MFLRRSGGEELDGSTHPLNGHRGNGTVLVTHRERGCGLSIAVQRLPFKSPHAAASRSVVLTLGRRVPDWPATVEHPKPARVS